ncbi:MAG TPA: glutamate--tRNA ligase [Actinomycetes bacterium]|nr:glutamate--tRNA ligase [Actinomycetes bacterium]
MAEDQRPVRVRVAPSPTGDPHVGTAYMSLFNLAFARQQGGQFVLRIEDTDRARYVADSEAQVFQTLHWLGLDWDEGPDKGGPYAPYRQSERGETYRPYVAELLDSGHAYHCWCTTERLAQMREEQQKAKQPTGYDRLCVGKSREERAALPGFSEQPVVRMLIPDDVPLVFDDVIRGEVKAPRPDDQVIVKADGFPTYHLANVVDDHEMAITHVVRGEEWISSTPKHVLLYDWLGWERPRFAHMPLLRNTDKSKISKRKNPAARLTWFVEQGYLPEALRNFLALMGYSQPDGTEVFAFDDMVRDFDWARVNTVGPVFDLDKLGWLNGHYVRELSVDDLADRIVSHLSRRGVLPAQPTEEQRAVVRAATPLVNERMQVLCEAEGMLGFLLVDERDFHVDVDDAAKVLTEDAVPTLGAALRALEEVAPWATADIEAALRAALVEGLGLKPKVAFGPVRVAATGRRVSPPLFESLELLGRDRSLDRLRAGLALADE